MVSAFLKLKLPHEVLALWFIHLKMGRILAIDYGIKRTAYSAVIYGAHGETWVYTNPEPLTYVRHPVTVDYIEDGTAFLSDGPASGTEVVSVGVTELFGAEFEVGH
jgi:hypothetical protein